MDYQNFKDCVRRAGLGLKEFAELLGMNHRSISNYSKRGTVPEHLAVIALMAMELKRRDVDLEGLFAKLDTPNKQGRMREKEKSKGRLRWEK